jgi:Uncharacterized protein conserved in bacteria (DUF2330)
MPMRTRPAQRAALFSVRLTVRLELLASAFRLHLWRGRINPLAEDGIMVRSSVVFALLGALLLATATPSADSACCYFAAKDKDILQPAQKAFITWSPADKAEAFTVQPKFEGNAVDFGMVIPTPTQPKLHEMPRDFFKELAVFTILEPMDLSKYKRPYPLARFGAVRTAPFAPAQRTQAVRILEAGIVGSLDYKIIRAERADDLYAWLKDNKYSYSGDEATLDFYIKKAWFFTVMKIDPVQMKKKPDGSYEGDVTPTRFTFKCDEPIYPLKITQISVKDRTEVLLYIQAPEKMDLAGEFSYEPTWVPMWSQATSFAIPEKLTKQEIEWQKHVQGRLNGFYSIVQQQRQQRLEPAALEWAKKITAKDIAILDGQRPYNRDAPAEDVRKLKLLKGHLKQGQFVTKVRKVFHKGEMDHDLAFVRAKVAGEEDDIEYFSILPTSPP